MVDIAEELGQQAEARRARPGDRAAPDRLRPRPIANHDEAVGVAREYAAVLAAGRAERGRREGMPDRELALLDVSGLIGITIPRAEGGPDLAAITVAEVLGRIAAVDPGIAGVGEGHFRLVKMVAACGSGPQRRRLFDEVLTGGRLGGAAGGPVRLGRSGLAGSSSCCAGAPTARWLAVSALDAQDRRVLAFVRRTADGVVLRAEWRPAARGPGVGGQVSFDAVAVDPELVISSALPPAAAPPACAA